MLEISLDEKDLKRGLGQLLRNATDSRPMMRSIASELTTLTEDNFESESWGGKKWNRSQAADTRSSTDGKHTGKTLQAKGQLAASINTKVGNSFARIGSNKKYAAIHHLGGQAGRGKKLTLPARRYLPIDGDGKLQRGAEEALLDIALKSLAKGV